MFLRITLSLIFACTVVAAGAAPADSRGSGTGTNADEVQAFPGAPTPATEVLPPTDQPAWTAQQVRDWAAAESPTANLLEAERCAVTTNIDRDDTAQCMQAGLLQSVLRHLVAHQRNLAAAEALQAYYRIVGIQRQERLLVEAIEVLEQLIEMAERAEELQLADGDPDALRRQQLELQSQRVEAEYGMMQLRVQLAALTGQPLEAAYAAALVSSLEPTGRVLQPDDAVRDALANRQDLQAIETLCRQINSRTLPAVRQLFSGLQPGLGLAAAASGGHLSLLSLHGTKPDNGDLACRRQQCYALREARRSQIETETRVAVLDLMGKRQRLPLAEQRVELAETAFRESQRAIELDRVAVGTDKQRRLELLEIRGEYVQLLTDAKLAEVRLAEVQGVATRN